MLLQTYIEYLRGKVEDKKEMNHHGKGLGLIFGFPTTSTQAFTSENVIVVHLHQIKSLLQGRQLSMKQKQAQHLQGKTWFIKLSKDPKRRKVQTTLQGHDSGSH